MSEASFPSLRREVHDYLRSCEHLLSVTVAPHNPPFSPDKLQIVNYYVAEVANPIGQLAKVLTTLSLPESYHHPSEVLICLHTAEVSSAGS